MLQEAGKVTGRVINAATKAAIEGIKVCATQFPENMAHCASTNGEGEYLIVGLPPGGYALRVETTGFNYLPNTHAPIQSRRGSNG